MNNNIFKKKIVNKMMMPYHWAFTKIFGKCPKTSDYLKKLSGLYAISSQK